MFVQSQKTMQITYELRLIRFLSGLNESYDREIRQILLKGITPTLNQAYAIITKDEIQQLACVISLVKRLIQFLSRLNESYDQARSQLL